MNRYAVTVNVSSNLTETEKNNLFRAVSEAVRSAIGPSSGTILIYSKSGKTCTIEIPLT